MSITLTPDGQGAIALPDDLIWTDEFQWQAAVSNVTTTTTGGIIVQGGARTAGRPITLAGSINYAWLLRPDLQALTAEADVFGTQYTLQLHDATQYTVQWAPGEGRIQAEPVREVANPSATTRYFMTLHFITV